MYEVEFSKEQDQSTIFNHSASAGIHHQIAMLTGMERAKACYEKTPDPSSRCSSMSDWAIEVIEALGVEWEDYTYYTELYRTYGLPDGDSCSHFDPAYLQSIHIDVLKACVSQVSRWFDQGVNRRTSGIDVAVSSVTFQWKDDRGASSFMNLAEATPEDIPKILSPYSVAVHYNPYHGTIPSSEDTLYSMLSFVNVLEDDKDGTIPSSEDTLLSMLNFGDVWEDDKDGTIPSSEDTLLSMLNFGNVLEDDKDGLMALLNRH